MQDKIDVGDQSGHAGVVIVLDHLKSSFDMIDMPTDTGFNPDWKFDIEKAIFEVNSFLEYEGVDIFKSDNANNATARADCPHAPLSHTNLGQISTAVQAAAR